MCVSIRDFEFTKYGQRGIHIWSSHFWAWRKYKCHAIQPVTPVTCLQDFLETRRVRFDHGFRMQGMLVIQCFFHPTKAITPGTEGHANKTPWAKVRSSILIMRKRDEKFYTKRSLALITCYFSSVFFLRNLVLSIWPSASFIHCSARI